VIKIKVAIYCRVSTEDQNPENQKLELERFAKAMNWDFVTFEETESSRNTRPIKNKVYQEALQKKWDLILVWKLDRWGRSLQELVTELDILKRHNVQFRTLKDNVILDDNPTNQLMINILSSFAQFERDIGRDRTKSGQARARSEGKIIGRHRKDCKCGNCKYSKPSNIQGGFASQESTKI
jgi:DNA invertase Pin-like site-specific DNA recombinase